MKRYLILLISIVLDGLIPNITLYSFNNITYFTPVCTGISLIFLYDNNKSFYKILFFTIFVYGTLYINNLILSFILFSVIYLIIKIFKKLFRDNFITIIIQILLVIMSWDLVLFIINSLHSNDFLWSNYLYKLSHSIIFNLLYGLILFRLFSSKLNY